MIGGGGGSTLFSSATGRSATKGSGDPGVLLVEARDASDARLLLSGSVSEKNSLKRLCGNGALTFAPPPTRKFRRLHKRTPTHTTVKITIVAKTDGRMTTRREGWRGGATVVVVVVGNGEDGESVVVSVVVAVVAVVVVSVGNVVLTGHDVVFAGEVDVSSVVRGTVVNAPVVGVTVVVVVVVVAVVVVVVADGVVVANVVVDTGSGVVCTGVVVDATAGDVD